MSSMLEQLWPVFLAETGEQLESLETALDRHGRRKTAPDIDALFRDFHTLKSSFSMVDLGRLVELAHACEDVLHGLRKSGTPVDNTIKPLLLESVDWLKQQLAEATPGHYPTQGNEALLARLAPYRPPGEDENPPPGQEAEAAAPAAVEARPKASSLLDEERDSLAVSTLRISSNMLDDLVTHVGAIAQQEATLAHLLDDDNLRVTLEQARAALGSTGGHADRQPLEQLVRQFQSFRKQLLDAESSIQNAITSIQQTVLDLRVIPLSIVFNRLPRIVRKRASEHGKTIQLTIEGGDIQIDKGMIDEVTEPLVHILQNAIDHGIETPEERQAQGKPANASIQIHATEQGGLLRIEIRDDGRGIDYRQVRDKAISKGIARAGDASDNPGYWLAFLFTREYHQTDTPAGAAPGSEDENLSGLDRVRSRLAALGGAMEISSEPGSGTRMTMRIPVTVAIQSVMLVQAGSQVLAIPTRNILEIVGVAPDALETGQGQSSWTLRNNPLPVYHLDHLLNIQPLSGFARQERIELAILQHDNHSIALAVDGVLDRQELFVRDIHPDLRNIPGIGGVSLLGNGQVVIILDVENLFTLARQKPHILALEPSPATSGTAP